MRRRLLLVVPLGSLLFASLALGGEAPRARFEVTDLGGPAGGTSEAHALNERGDVAGSLHPDDRSSRAFVFRGGRLTDLGKDSDFKNTGAFGINNAGQVVGFGSIQRDIFTKDTGQPLGAIRSYHALLWEGGDEREIADGQARDINNRGQVVGHTFGGAGFLWDNGRITYLYDPDKDLGARAINDVGEVAGAAAPKHGSTRTRHAFRWKAGRSEILAVGYTGGAQPGAFALNLNGEITGVGGGLDGTAFLWTAGKITPLGTLNGPVEVGPLGQHAGYHYSAALGINDRGHVVGTGSTTTDGRSHLRAFLWESGRMVNLNALIDPAGGWILEEARAINNRGQICGVGSHHGVRRAFLLTPDR